MELLIAFATNLFTQFLKGTVYKKFGVYGVYAVVLIVSLIGTFVYTYVYSVPEWQTVIVQALKTMAFAVAIYEVILKRVGFGEVQK